MTLFGSTTATLATMALILPGAALAKPDAPVGSGKAGAPGQVCKSLKVKGKKTPEQRAAYKACIKDAVAKRKADHAAKAKDDVEADDDTPITSTAPTARS